MREHTSAPPLTPEQRKLRAQIAATARRRPPDDPDLAAARRVFEASRWADHIERLLASAPPLTEGQRTRLATLLGPPGRRAAVQSRRRAARGGDAA